MTQNQRTILIVDDCLEDREAYRRYLHQDERYSYRILEEEIGESALELCRQIQPDAILLDFALPDMDGVEFLNELQSQIGSSKLPVVMLTGQGDEAIAVQSMKSGASDYLVKGKTTPDSLRKAIHYVIKQTDLKRQLEESEARNRAAVEALRDREEQLRMALEAARMGIWNWNLLTNQITWSRGHEQLFGLEPGTFDGTYERFDTCLHPEDRAPLSQALNRALKEHTDYQHEYRIIWPDGSIHWIEGKGRAFYNETGQPVRMTGTVMDISRRKQAQQALQAQFQQQRLVMEISQRIRQSLNLNDILNTTVEEVRQFLQTDRTLIFRFDPDWTGAVAVESVGEPWIAILSTTIRDPCFGEDYVEPFKQGLVTAKSDIYTAGIGQCHLDLLAGFQVRANLVVPILRGENLWGLLIAHHCSAPRQWQQSEIDLLRQLATQVGIAIQQSTLFEQVQTELLERQKAENQIRALNAELEQRVLERTAQLRQANQELTNEIAERKQAQAILQESERRWRYLLENVHLVVVGLNNFGEIEFANPYFLQVTGYTKAEVLRKNWFEMFLPLREQQQIHTVFQEVLEQEFHPHYQNVILTKTGEERMIAWNNTQLRNLQGEVIGTMSIGDDITERYAIEKIKNEFISIVSHELRTPLTSIRGSLGILATGALQNHPERMQRMIEIAALDSERLVRLVNDILDLERLESGKVSLVKEYCDAADLMMRAAEGMRVLALRESITLSVVPVSVLVWASADHIIQTITNLLSNAIKFSPPHSTIRLTAQPQGDYVLFQVHDQGRGIPSDKLENIFGRFQQVDASDSRDKGGTGLGLAICRSIITQHRGQIWVESVLGQGSTFYFTVPISSESKND